VEPAVLIPIIVLAVVVVISLFAVITGRLRHVRIGTDGIELVGHDRRPASTTRAPVVAPHADPPVLAEAWRTQRWRERVEADHDIYFGRREQGIDELTALIAGGPTGTITSIRGVGGIGKTASAFEAVEGAAGQYSMVAWASFRPHRIPPPMDHGQCVGRSSRDVLRDLARQLGLNINTSEATIENEFRAAMPRLARSERVLLVVDNLERMADVADVVRIFTQDDLVRHCHLVMTTRAAAAQLDPAVAERLIGNLSLGPSCDLIRHEGDSSPDVRSADNEALAPIHSAVDGNPYLMKLVARRMCHQTRPLDRLLRDIKRLDDTSPSQVSTEIQDYMFSSSLWQLGELTDPKDARALIHAFCSEPPGSRIAHGVLKKLSGLDEQTFQNTLDAANLLSLVSRHGLNDRFSIHSLLHDFTRAGATGAADDR
jgi:hypothetical protein